MLEAIGEGGQPKPLEALAGLSRRDRKRLKREIERELDRQARSASERVRQARKEAREADRAQARRASDILKERSRRAKALKSRSQEHRDARSAAEDVVSAIGYDLMNVSGVCEVEPGLFSETIAFDDIAYQNSREQDQRATCIVLQDLYNYFGPDAKVQVSVSNTPLRDDELEGRAFFDPAAQPSESLAEDARELNRILDKKLKEGVSNIRRSRSLTVAVEAADMDEAIRRFARINTDLTSFFKRLRCPWHVMEGKERLAAICDVLRPGKRLDFSYERDISPLSPLTTKDFVAPMALDFRPNGESTLYRSDDAWCQALVVRSLASPLTDRVIASLVDLAMPITVTWYLTPLDKSRAINDLKVKSGLIDNEVIANQRQAVRKGYDFSIMPTELQSSRDEIEDLLMRVSGQTQNLFLYSGLVWTCADTLEQLTTQVGQIIDAARPLGVEIDLLPYQQREAMNSVLPLGCNLIQVERYLTSEEACIFVPFASNELSDPHGNWYYQNRLTNNLVFGDRSRLSSPVGFISGKTGSGKTFFSMNEILGTVLSHPNEQTFVFDRSGEYARIVRHVGGTVASFGPGTSAHLNPLGMADVSELSPEKQVAFKADAIVATSAAAADDTNKPLDDAERSIIQRCVEEVYRRSGAEGRTAVLQDFYDCLLEQPEPQAKALALRYERYVKGAMSFFNHEDNIDLSARVVDLNLKDIPSSMTVFALITMCEVVRNQMYRNHEQGKRTWLYIEEMESLFRYPPVLEYFRRLANEGRKFGLYLTGITQSTESMVRNEDVSAIVKNSDFVMLLKQSAEDRAYWADALGLSDFEAACIDETTEEGYGLLVFGATRIPIRGDFPRDSYLYRLFSTNPNEHAEIARSRGARE